ncbi:MAG: hypothetical protein MI864_05105, partial [Pseudomonadales bacterium]|nr:hypothetical protein [Pseudomonadales bacterium]
QPIMKIMLVCALMNVPISYVLGGGLYGFEGYGISGVAWATALMTYTMFFWLGFELLQHPTTRSILANWKRSHSTRQDYAIFWSLGVPIALAIIMEMGLFTSASLLAGTLGTLALAANQICLNIATVSFNIYIGIAQATAIKVGFNYGLSQSPEQGDPKAIESARRYGRAGLKLGLITASVSATLMFFFPELWVKLFTLNSTESRLDELMLLAASLLGVAALFQLADCSQVIAMHALRAFKLGASPTLISIFGYWVIGFPAAWLMKDEFGLIGIWAGMGAGLLFTAITLTLLLERTATQKARSMMECST